MAFGIVENLASSFCNIGTGKISQISRLHPVLRGITLIFTCLSLIENGKQIFVGKMNEYALLIFQ